MSVTAALFHLVAYPVNAEGQPTGPGERLTRYPMSQTECVVMKSKFTPRKSTSIRLVPLRR